MAISSSNVTIDDVVINNIDLLIAIRKSFSRDPFDHYLNGVCGLFFCLLGTISNALSFSILIRRTMRLSTYVYLAGLCLSDFTACLFLIPAYILDAYPIEVLDYELPRTYTYTRLLIITGAISTTARALSVWLCVAFTIDRWIMICQPFVGPLYCTIKNARCVTLIIYIIGIFYAVPLLFEYEPHAERTLSEILLAGENKVFYRHRLTHWGKNSIFRWTYVLINALGVYIIPLTIIAILNRQLLIAIRLLEKRSAEYNAPLPTKQGVTIMLLATTVMLLVFRLPSAIISVMWLISAKMFVNEKPPFRLRKFHSIANVCATLNAATTFIMFIIYGTKFRSEFTRIYCCIWNQLRKTTKTKSTTPTMPLDQQQSKAFMLNNNNNNNNNNNINNSEDKEHMINDKTINNSNVNGPNSKRSTNVRNSSSAATTTTSMASSSSMKRLRILRRQQQTWNEHEHESMMNSNHEQHEVPIREDDLDDEENGTKSVILTVSYYDRLKKWIPCR